MLSNMRLSLALVAIIAITDATRTTLNDYVVLKTAINNPPACGVSYANVDVNRITALSGITGNHDTNCGACIEVCGSSGCGHLLVVDSCVGPDHLDISTTAGPAIVGSDTGVHEATYTFVDSSNCAGIWDGNGMDAVPNPPPNWELLRNGGGGAPAPVTESAPSTPPAAPETPQSPPAAPVEQDQAEPQQPPAQQPQEFYEAPPVVEQPEPQPEPSVVEQTPPPANTAPPAPPAPPAPSTTAAAPVEEAPAAPSAVPGDFYEDESHEDHSSVCTTVTSVPIESYGTPAVPSAPSSSPVSTVADGESSATPGPSSLLTIITGSPTATLAPILPTATAPTPSAPTPPIFTGAASRSSSLPVLAGSVFGVFVAFLF